MLNRVMRILRKSHDIHNTLMPFLWQGALLLLLTINLCVREWFHLVMTNLNPSTTYTYNERVTELVCVAILDIRISTFNRNWSYNWFLEKWVSNWEEKVNHQLISIESRKIDLFCRLEFAGGRKSVQFCSIWCLV